MTMVLLPLASANAQLSSSQQKTKSQAQFKTAEDKQAFEYKDATKPYEFHSTSALAGSGSSLPIAAQSGVVISGNTPGENSSAGVHGGIRRIGGSGSGTGGNGAEENEDPQETPIGDGMWVLAILAAAYAAYIARRKVRAVRVREEA